MNHNEDFIYEASDIMAMFDLAEIENIIRAQINDSDDFGNIKMDHLRPLWVEYKRALESPDIDIRKDAESKFDEVCLIFIKLICDKYGIGYSDDLLGINSTNLYALTVALYAFFVLDIKSNIQNVLLSYITQNVKDLDATFHADKGNKDAPSGYYRKNVKPELIGILSNIYDVTSWILDTMTTETFFTHIEQAYVPLELIQKSYEEELIYGDFVSKIAEMYTGNHHIRSIICFDISETLEKLYALSVEDKIKSGVLKDD